MLLLFLNKIINKMAQFDENQMYICGSNNNMINYKGKVYSRLIPIEQIELMSKKCCKNCEYYGSWNGCIIMWCMSCCPNGCGAINVGVEYNAKNHLSARSTYLKNIDWNTIGDINLQDSEQIYKKNVKEDDDYSDMPKLELIPIEELNLENKELIELAYQMKYDELFNNASREYLLRGEDFGPSGQDI